MIALEHISKQYGSEQVLHDVSFGLEAHHTLSILGKSGCGKSTLLKIMAGLEQADSGTFTVDGTEMFALSPQKRGVVYLSQEPLLFPHLNIYDNMAFGLKLRKKAKADIKERVEELAESLGINEHLTKMPTQLSGGQRQRVAFGRALIINPKVMLLDEPFGSLDAHTRAEMQQLYKAMSSHYKITSLFVTHELKEALIMGNRIAKMDKGRLNVYPSIDAFLSDPGSGAQEELRFWGNLNDRNFVR